MMARILIFFKFIILVMSEIYESDFRLKIIQEGLCMARRKIKITDFIQTCETNCRLKHLADSFVPSCSLYDVIDGNYVPPQKEKTRKRSSSRRMADAENDPHDTCGLQGHFRAGMAERSGFLCPVECSAEPGKGPE